LGGAGYVRAPRASASIGRRRRRGEHDGARRAPARAWLG
jgi:hypothetical protein